MNLLYLLLIISVLLVNAAHINDIKNTITDILNDIDTVTNTNKLTDTKSITGGRIQGYINNDNTVETYLGIPYAAAPVGTNRFKVTQPVNEWNDIKQTIHVPNACPQLKLSHDSKFYYGDEDCLYLNVYTPHNANNDENQLLPVMLWLYGGAYVLGDSYSLGLYNGGELAKQHNVIVVVPNYRLGTLGFMALDELGNEADNIEGTVGNAAMMDQVAVMKWIKQNIATFGGDPKRVTLAGESAGAFSVCFHIASPLSAGLFSGAIMESGSCDSTSFFLDKQQSIEHSKHISKHVGCNVNSDKLLQCLRSVPVEQLLDYNDDQSHQAIQLMRLTETLNEGIVPQHNNLKFDQLAPWLTTTANKHYFGPTIDHVALHDIPLNVIKTGNFNAVPVLAGYNKDEGSIFVRKINDIIPSANSPITESDLRAALLELVIHNDTAVDQIFELYPKDQYLTTQTQASAIITDWFFGCEATRALKAITEHGSVNTYAYRFTYTPSFIESILLGTYHGSELFYVFNKNIPVIHSFNKHDIAIANTFGTYWSNFMYSHNPNKPVQLHSDVEWPVYDSDTLDSIAIDLKPTIQHNYNSVKCELWEEINNNMKQ